ncbi:glycosyl transferase [Mucilaginibacter rubeus]|uniref:glycosyl transferase n=1 Tax=Mucilaginibacter rubeus TaxID=2027860 RepID=UPI00166D87D0|nr:glycosyl transferase [Mucilaginibacter rubeus]
MNGRREMEQRSLELPPVVSHTNGLPIYFLTGKNYLYQTLYCIQSLIKSTAAQFKFILVDDGSFNAALVERVAKQLPGTQVITVKQISENLQNTLPETCYPYLHKKRAVYPHIKKLTDVHTIPGDDWKLVLDSDMLFWHEPKEIITWLYAPQQPLHMIDCTEAYGYSQQLMEQLTGAPVKPLLNVGAIGLKSEAIDWDKLENWVKTLEEQEGASYYLEQALSAMMIADTDAAVLKAGDYIVNPGPDQIKNKTGILHHYVDLSKEGYFKQAWKHFL